MRWLLLNHNLRGRGTWHRAWMIARELARAGHSVTLWTAAPHHYYRPHAETRDGVLIVETPSWSPLVNPDDGWGLLDLPWRLARALREPLDVTYAFAHPPNNYLPALLLKRGRGVPLLYDWCDWYAGGIFPRRAEQRAAGLAPPPRPLQRWAERREVAMERAMPRLADGVTVISRQLHMLARELGVPEARLLLLPNGAPLDQIQPGDPLAARRELGIPPEWKCLGYVANYHPDEEFLLRAVARAALRVPDLKLLYTGPPFAPALVAKLGLELNLHALGNVPEARLGLVLAAADVLCLPLANNPHNIARLPYKLTDYLAAGRPVATCAVGDVTEIFAAARSSVGPIGFATDPDINPFGDALAELLETPILERTALGAAARGYAEHNLCWSRLTSGLLDFYMHLCRR